MSSDALDTLLERLTHGEIDAAEEVFLTFEPVLRVMVRRRLTPRLRASSTRWMSCSRSGPIF